jgi:PAS domain S-box-containing protein
MEDAGVASQRPAPPTRASTEHQIILLALAASLFAWIMRAALDFYFISEKSFSDALLLDVSPRELYSRVAISTAFLLTGIIISRAVHRLRSSEARASRLDQCVRSVRAINQLITRVHDRSALCQRACDELVAGLGYHRVQARLDGVTRGFAELASAEPFAGSDSAREAVTIPIGCDGDKLGELIVTPGPELEWDNDERALLTEVAEDIAFSVKSMSTAEHLHQQREEVQTILDSVSAYISYKDRCGRYIRVNKALADIACIPKEDWIGRTINELVPRAGEVVMYADEDVLATGRARHSALEALELPQGTRWIQTDRVPHRDSNGVVVGVIALSVDVTDRMEAERALACKEEQLRQSQKMEAIGQLAGGIAHDFNNLLTAISGYTELALGQMESDSPACEMLLAVSKGADRAAALTRQLLAFSRKQPLRLAEQNLNEVVSGMTDMLERLIGEDIELVTDLDEQAGTIDADASQIEQVLMNLAVNARDAMPHGGRLTIGTSISDRAPTECENEQGSDTREFACLRVSDTGVGMDSKTMSQIFDLFFTTKRPGVGTGLGLSVVDGIVEQHGGWVTAESDPGCGTSFRVYLPMAEHRAHDEDAQCYGGEAVGEIPAANGERILLVEDEDAVRAFATRALTDWGYEILGAASAEEAIETLEGDPLGFDLVFSDIVLPGKSGTQLAEEIHARDRNARILLTSGYLFPDRYGNDQPPPDTGFPLLKKPYSTRGLRLAIHSALSQA